MLRRALEIAHSLGGAAGGLVASTSTELAQRLRALGREGEAVAVEAALREPKVPAAIESATVPKR
jgi:hypothetical protein